LEQLKESGIVLAKLKRGILDRFPHKHRYSPFNDYQGRFLWVKKIFMKEKQG
jgi:hypothetical protein